MTLKNNELQKSWESKILFIVGTIIIVVAILVIVADIGFRMYGPTGAGYYAMVAFLAYLFGNFLVVYSIHLVRNNWGQLGCPIFIVILILVPPLPEMPISYRLGWLLVFPMIYVAFLILFLVSIKKENSLRD